MPNRWNLSAILEQVERLARAHAGNAASGRYPGARLSHARARTGARSIFAQLVAEAPGNIKVAFYTVTEHDGGQILWVKLLTPVHGVEWLEITEVRPHDRNVVDALVFAVPGFADDEERKISLDPPFQHAKLRFQQRGANRIVASGMLLPAAA